jgi:hypothetical protein
VPGLGADDQKVAEYAAQAVGIVPTLRNELAQESIDQVLIWNPVILFTGSLLLHCS